VIRLVVGLGNPGKEYERTRHNAGFWLVERFAQANGIALRKDPKFKALVGKREGGAAGSSTFFVLPQSFMNASGQPVQMLAGFFRIKPEEMLVVHDELDFAPGVARIKQGGGIAGHNGLKDISQRVASHNYWRLRIGIGHPGDKDVVADYVLHKPSAEDKAAIDQAIDRALQVMPELLGGDMQAAIQKLHSGEPKPAEKKEPPKKEVPIKEPEKKEPEPQKSGGLLKSLFGKK
jgi:peptidyl-tRNA hydrolase, PTH1 family